MEPLLPIEKAAETLGISPWTVRSYVKAGKLACVRIGRRVLIEAAELRRFIEESKQARTEQASVGSVA